MPDQILFIAPTEPARIIGFTQIRAMAILARFPEGEHANFRRIPQQCRPPRKRAIVEHHLVEGANQIECAHEITSERAGPFNGF